MEQVKTSVTIGNRDFVIPEKSSKIWEIFNKVFAEIIKDNPGMEAAYKGARFEILIVYPNASKTCAARICRTGRHVKLLNDYDYIIEFSGELWDKITEKSKELLMLHELKHVRIDYDKHGEVKYRLIQHDVQDFYSILSKYGFDYITELREAIVDINGTTANIKSKDNDNVKAEKEKKAKQRNEQLARSIRF